MIRLSLRVPAEQAELVLAELLELAPEGVEERELPGGALPGHLLPGGDSLLGGDPPPGGGGSGGLVEYAIYGSPGELPRLPDLHAAVAGVPVEVSTSELPDDWSERWKQFHRPVLVEPPAPAASGMPSSFHSLSVFVPSLHIRPPWENESSIAGAEEIVVDPGQAFGTGAHATTHLCLELLLALAAADPARGAVLDVGAGSGVLGIAAAKLGYGPVVALDNERESVAATRENAAVNGVEVDARRFDLRREPPPAGERSLVLANLLRPLLLELAGSMQRAPAHLIASGLLREEADEVAGAFADRLSLRERERHERGEWAALWLVGG